ncbi:hypothetical protein SCLCIDRAFT_1193059 [Scleroderma citrinum Foug A]|uniref:Uncharacterized protein n=1 Tax=Scleroderma citrinum Foug A TaxID=1036808 RepID=A0A0C3DAD0_9AGAM|nr:hypothetical protein SCLCIDRAFT_1193059 [Scleroderma citrinum Foug A]
MHECILDTFALFLESICNVPGNISSRKKPQAALFLDLCLVERAFRFWSTGNYTLPEGKNLRQFSAAQWSHATNEVMESIDKLSDKKWKKIVEGAEAYVGAHKSVPSKDVTCA